MRTNLELMLAAAPAAFALSFAAASSVGGPGPAAAVTDASSPPIVARLSRYLGGASEGDLAPGDRARDVDARCRVLAVRVVAELRYLGSRSLVPAYTTRAGVPFVYVVVLLYLQREGPAVIAGLAAPGGLRGAGSSSRGRERPHWGVGAMVLATVLRHPGRRRVPRPVPVLGSISRGHRRATVVVLWLREAARRRRARGRVEPVVLAMRGARGVVFAATLVSRAHGGESPTWRAVPAWASRLVAAAPAASATSSAAIEHAAPA